MVTCLDSITRGEVIHPRRLDRSLGISHVVMLIIIDNIRHPVIDNNLPTPKRHIFAFNIYLYDVLLPRAVQKQTTLLVVLLLLLTHPEVFDELRATYHFLTTCSFLMLAGGLV